MIKLTVRHLASTLFFLGLFALLLSYVLELAAVPSGPIRPIGVEPDARTGGPHLKARAQSHGTADDPGPEEHLDGLLVRVLDELTNSAISGAAVQVFDAAHASVGSSRTDTFGLASFALDSEDGHHASVALASASGFESQSGAVPNESTAGVKQRALTIRLRGNGTLHLRLIDVATGAPPLKAGWARIRCSSPSLMTSAESLGARVPVPVDGRLTMTSLPGDADVHIEAGAPGYLTRLIGPIRSSVTSPSEPLELSLAKQRKAYIYLRGAGIEAHAELLRVQLRGRGCLAAARPAAWQPELRMARSWGHFSSTSGPVIARLFGPMSVLLAEKTFENGLNGMDAIMDVPELQVRELRLVPDPDQPRPSAEYLTWDGGTRRNLTRVPESLSLEILFPARGGLFPAVQLTWGAQRTEPVDLTTADVAHFRMAALGTLAVDFGALRFTPFQLYRENEAVPLGPDPQWDDSIASFRLPLGQYRLVLGSLGVRRSVRVVAGEKTSIQLAGPSGSGELEVVLPIVANPGDGGRCSVELQAGWGGKIRLRDAKRARAGERLIFEAVRSGTYTVSAAQEGGGVSRVEVFVAPVGRARVQLPPWRVPSKRMVRVLDTHGRAQVGVDVLVEVLPTGVFPGVRGVTDARGEITVSAVAGSRLLIHLGDQIHIRPIQQGEVTIDVHMEAIEDAELFVTGALSGLVNKVLLMSVDGPLRILRPLPHARDHFTLLGVKPGTYDAVMLMRDDVVGVTRVQVSAGRTVLDAPLARTEVVPRLPVGGSTTKPSAFRLEFMGAHGMRLEGSTLRAGLLGRTRPMGGGVTLRGTGVLTLRAFGLDHEGMRTWESAPFDVDWLSDRQSVDLKPKKGTHD